MSKTEAKRDKQLKRELENLERGLRRGNVELVLEALAALPGTAAAERLEAARAWLAPKLEVACRERSAAALSPWLRALGREPRLLERLGEGNDERRWSLLWGAVKAQSYKQAELLWGPLAERVRAEAPPIAVAIEALLSTRGRPDPALIPSMLTPRDERLGIEPVRARHAATWPAPLAPEEAVPRLLELREGAGWSSFAELAEQWLTRASAPCAARLCAPVAELALLALSEASASSSSRKGEVARLVLAADRRFAELRQNTASVVEPADQQRLDRALSLVLRAAFAELVAPADAEGSRREWLSATVRRALRLSNLRTPIRSALSLSPSCKALTPLADLLQELHAEAPAPALWARAALALDFRFETRLERGRETSDSSWRWIVTNLGQHLAVPRELIAGVSTLARGEQARLFQMLEELLAPDLAVDLITSLFDLANERQRSLLVALARSALATAADLPFCDECEEYHLSSHDDGLNYQVLTSAKAQALVRRLEPLLLPHDEIFLQIALHRATGQREQRAVFDRYLAPGVPIDNYLNALAHSRRLKLPPKPLRERLRAAFSGQVSPLTRGFELSLHRFGVRSVVCKDLAELLVVAADQARPESLPADARRRLQLARKLLRRSPKRLVSAKQLKLFHEGSR